MGARRTSQSGTGGQYDVRDLAVRGDVIVVTVSYRLTAMGFRAPCPDVREQRRGACGIDDGATDM